MRQALIVGNWKMHGSRSSVDELLGGLLDADAGAVDVVVCPSYVHLQQALARTEAGGLSVGAQDCSHVQAGAYTGEVSSQMLADMGCRWVILGHSERRQYHGESDELVAAKIGSAVESGLRPILCVGESKAQREAGEAEAVVAAQLAGALQDQLSLAGLTVAYEPVWAIGTGLTASPEQAQQMHAFIREHVRGLKGVAAEELQLLYGGSVKPDNAALLFAQPDIDGALVGGAALKVEDFTQIIVAANAAAE
ncbi:MAG: triose-phosphate isomerase [Halioglobus sp.]